MEPGALLDGHTDVVLDQIVYGMDLSELRREN